LLAFIGETEGANDPTNRRGRSDLIELIRQLRLGGNTTWTGHLPLPEVSAHLLAADAAVLPFTDGASFRRTSLLAMLAHGLPLVTTSPEHGPTSTPETPSGGGPMPFPMRRHGVNCLLVNRIGGAAPARGL
ncbi:MAG: hypothetical protein NTZ05_19705, partial [Chloroflexi bacterium]|nr:hypothetical protein [Chloroflexota bacterium]